jgi:HEAT repeat protein
LSDSSPDFVGVCIASLGEFGGAASPYADKIAAIYDTSNATVRGAVCSALARFRSKGAVAVPVLIRGLQDTDEGVRTSAALGLSEFATLPEDVIPALEKALQDSSSMVRWYSAQALGQFGPLATNAIPFLEQSCSDAESPVRSAAIRALQRIRQEPAERFVVPWPGMK